jgi:hypothetical protein
MHHFKDQFGNLMSIEDRLWPSVLQNERDIKETDKHGNLLAYGLIEPKIQEVIVEVIPEVVTKKDIIPEIKKKVEYPSVNILEPLKVEKIKTHAKNTRTISKRKAKKA